MRAIVTGSAGFIGSHLCDALLALGWDVIGIDDYSAGKGSNLANALKNVNFADVRADVCDKRIEQWFDGVDVVFHNAASKKNICLKNPHRDLEVNAGGTLNLLECARKYHVKKFIHASTGSVYGEPCVFPQDENHPLNPCSFYGVSKLAGERYVNMFHTTFGLNTTILRYFHVFGLRQDSTQDKGGVVAIFLHKIKNGELITIHGTGDQQRSFTYVADIVNANLFAATNELTNGQVFNVASGLKISINELVNLLRKITNTPVMAQMGQRLIGDIDRFDISNEKLRSLGFEFKTNFESNLNEMWLGL